MKTQQNVSVLPAKDVSLATATIAKLDLVSGDVVVLSFLDRLHSEQRNHAMEGMRKLLPDGVRLVLLDGGTTISKLSAADAAATGV